MSNQVLRTENGILYITGSVSLLPRNIQHGGGIVSFLRNRVSCSNIFAPYFYPYRKWETAGAAGFHFFPFAVSRRYQVELSQRANHDFIVSCADKSAGYLDHSCQIEAGGCEVTGSAKSQNVAAGLAMRNSSFES